MNTKKITNKAKFSSLNKIGLSTAFLSWLIATILLIWSYFAGNASFALLLGLLFFWGALVVNSTIGVAVLVASCLKRSKGNICTLLAIFANIPIGIVYFFIVMSVIMAYRVVLINNTDYPITAGRIIDYVNDIQIDPYSSKTFYINAQGKGALTMDYNYKDNRYQDTLISYITNGGGGKVIYEFNENKNILTGDRNKRVSFHSDLLLSKKVAK